MTEMVERVARAICAAYGNEWDESLDDSLYAPANHPGLPGKDDWREMARAAIAAMREEIDDGERVRLIVTDVSYKADRSPHAAPPQFTTPARIVLMRPIEAGQAPMRVTIDGPISLYKAMAETGEFEMTLKAMRPAP